MQLYGFTARDCDRLHALLAAYEQGRIRVDVPAFARPNAHQQDSFLAATTVSIAAGALGNANLVDLDTASPPNQSQITTVPTLPIYNPLSTALPAGTYLFVREPSQGYFVPATSVGSTLSNNAGSSGAFASLTAGSWTTYANLSISIPSAGTYLLFATVAAEVQKPNAGASTVEAILYDITNAVQIGPAFVCAGVNSGGTTSPGSLSGGSIVWPYVFSGAVTLGFQTYFNDSGGGGSAQICNTLGATNNATSLGYVKIG